MLEDFISRNPAHIYFLQETKFGPNHNFSFPSFSTFSSPNRVGCGGVALLVHSGLRVRNLRRVSGMIDGVFLDVCLGGGWITVGSVYVHPVCSDIGWLRGFLSSRTEFLVGGDLNARHHSFGDASSNFIGVALAQFSDDTGVGILSPPVPTCFHSASGSFIDKFLVSPRPNFAFSGIDVLTSFSDHAGISISVHCPTFDLSVRNGFVLKQYNFANVSRMNGFLERELAALNMPTGSGLMGDDLELLAARIGEIFSRAADRFVPSTFVRTNGILLSRGTVAVLRKYHSSQRRLFRGMRNGSCLPTINAIRVEVRLLRQMMLDAIRCDLNSHYRSTMANTISTRHAHRTIVTHTGYRKRAKCPSMLYTDETKTVSVSGTPEIADSFRQRFADNHHLSTGMHSDADTEVRSFVCDLPRTNSVIPFSEVISPSIPDGACLREIERMLPVGQRGLLTSAAEVSDLIRLSPSKRSTGTDDMPYFLLKRFSPQIVLFLTIFFNHLLSCSLFPSPWKHSLVTPIPKPNKDSSVISNWRPISNLNCVSKIFEKILARRLLSHIDRLDIFRNQFGFLRGISTCHALGHLQSTIDRGLNNGRFTALVSLDLRAAFDTVWHDGLVYKMGMLGFPIPLVRIIHSFLAGRTFAVRLDGHTTDGSAMPSGTPQGSVCSPILFNIYVHDVPSDNFVKTIQYADDTAVFCTSNDPDRVRNALNSRLSVVSRYLRRWKLILNEQKTDLIVFMGFAREANRTLRRKFLGLTLSLNGHLLSPKTRIRYLGLLMNRNNRFVQHIDHALARAKRAFFALRPILFSSLVDPRIKTNVYKIYVRPVLTYASAVWARPVCLSSHQMERVRSFERMVLRHTANVRRNIGSYVYANNSTLHEVANCPRIDRFIVEKAVGFFQRCSSSPVEKIRSLLLPGSGRVFPDLAHVWKQNANDELYENGNLVLFHRPYDGSDRLVYNTNQ